MAEDPVELSLAFPHPNLMTAWENDDYTSGSTEPWTQFLIASFVISMGAKRVLETGTFKGLTTAWLASTGAEVLSVDLEERGGPEFVESCDYGKHVTFVYSDALECLKAQNTDSFDLVFIDDEHTRKHVREEIIEAKRIIKSGGLILLHDVSVGAWGHTYPLHEFGGVAISLPKLHLAGGLGIITV